MTNYVTGGAAQRHLQPFLSAAISVFLFLQLQGSAAAIVIAPGKDDEAQPDSKPPAAEIAGFEHVARRGAYTAVYLGLGWVLTAGHVGVGPVRIGGVSYLPLTANKSESGGAAERDGGTRREFRNADGTHPDLIAFKIAASQNGALPGLGNIRLSSRSPSMWSKVVLVGNGRTRGEAIDWPEGPGEARRGWSWSAAGRLQSGTNRLIGVRLRVAMQGTVSRAMAMRFSRPEDPEFTEREAQVAVGDSGGALFAREGKRMVLAGILFARSTHPAQPSESAVYGNRSLAIDLASYREQLLRLIQPDTRARSGR